MASFTIPVPPPLREPIAELAGLSVDKAEALAASLAAAEPFRSGAELSTIVRDSLGTDDGSQAEGIVQALLSLATSFRDIDRAELAAAVSRSQDLTLEEPARARLRETLETLLVIPAIQSVARAIDLLTLHERNYRTSRVITDIRPVFGPNVEEPPPGAVIVQTLQLHTWDRAGQEETLYIAMDSADLQELHKVIERALTKTEALKSRLEETRMYYFELDKRGE
jgi:hypothetical protein